MRVLHFGKFTFHEFGGIERHVEGLTRGLAARGVETYAVVYDERRRGGPAIVDGVRVLHARCYGRPASLPLAPEAFTLAQRLARERAIDIVHLHFPDPLAHVVASTLRGDFALVASWHSDIVRQRWFGAAYRAAASLVLRPLDAVLLATPMHLAAARQIPGNVPAESRYVVPYGVDVRPFAPSRAVLDQAAALRAQWASDRVVFALGRHVYYKGFDVLIRAMRSVDGMLVLGGDGPTTHALGVLVRSLGLENRVRLVGPIPDHDLAAHFHACDVFCLPSTAPAEAFALVQAEAMACGKPVVNCALGNGVNFVSPADETGLTVPSSDDAALGVALTRLLDDRVLANRLGEAGRQRVARMFSMDAMVNGTLTAYERALHTRQ